MKRSLRGTLLIMAMAASVSAQNSGPACGTGVTVTNIYGQNGQFYLYVNDPTQPADKNPIIFQSFTLAASNGQTTLSLRQDQNGNPVSIKPGVTYTLTLETYGFGVCCGAFSSYTLALTQDLMFTNLSNLPSGATCSSATTCSGFLPPSFSSHSNTFSFMVNTSGTSCPVVVDPVPDLFPQSGGPPPPVAAFTSPTQTNLITQVPKDLAQLGTPVASVAADGVTTVLLRIPAITATDQIYLSVINDQNQPSESTNDDGGLSLISEQSFASSIPIPLTVYQPI
jgi:hypothetical protein